MPLIASRMNRIKPSPTLATVAKAAELKAKGLDVIGLGTGEPDFDTPQNIKNAAIAAINKGETKYTVVDGTNALKQAIQKKFARENGLSYELSEITVGTGGKQVLFNLLLATVESGDEVIIPAPYWVSYLDIVVFAEGVPVVVQAFEDTNFKMTAAQLEANITPKTKWLIINSPSNPTGAAYSDAELRELADVLLRHPHVHILSDDIYEHLVYDGFVCKNIVQIEPQLKARTFIVNGVSKAYSMTGWRLGYGAGDKAMIKAISVLQSQSTSNPSSISQAAAIEALNGPQDFIPVNNQLFQKRRDFILEKLNAIPMISCCKPEGAFYVYPSIKQLIGKKTSKGVVINNCTDFANYLLEEHLVAVVPGIAFGLENCFRISYATSDENLKKACERIRIAVSELS
jgi:aspartate aminotransferase